MVGALAANRLCCPRASAARTAAFPPAPGTKWPVIAPQNLLSSLRGDVTFQASKVSSRWPESRPMRAAQMRCCAYAIPPGPQTLRGASLLGTLSGNIFAIVPSRSLVASEKKTNCTSISSRSRASIHSLIQFASCWHSRTNESSLAWSGSGGNDARSLASTRRQQIRSLWRRIEIDHFD